MQRNSFLHNLFHNLVYSFTYVLRRSQSLDYETTSSYSLTVNVTDGSTTVSQPLTISIRDVNDAPSFTDAPYSVSVNENEAAGAVYTVSATDQDSGKFKNRKSLHAVTCKPPPPPQEGGFMFPCSHTVLIIMQWSRKIHTLLMLARLWFFFAYYLKGLRAVFEFKLTTLFYHILIIHHLLETSRIIMRSEFTLQSHLIFASFKEQSVN